MQLLTASRVRAFQQCRRLHRYQYEDCRRPIATAAGLSVALGLAGRRVDLLAKGPLANTGNSPLAQGGVAAAVGPGDSPEQHAAWVRHQAPVSIAAADGPAGG